jgi:hypothetical protein
MSLLKLTRGSRTPCIDLKQSCGGRHRVFSVRRFRGGNRGGRIGVEGGGSGVVLTRESGERGRNPGEGIVSLLLASKSKGTEWRRAGPISWRQNRDQRG